MQWLRGLILLGLAVSCAWSAQQFEFAAPQLSFARKKSVRAELFLSHEVAKPGDTVLAAIKLTHAPGWHTYWQNPGESGTPTEIHWALSNGISAGSIQWPVPEKLIDTNVGLITYVYHSNVVLVVPLKIAPDAPAGTNEVNALAKWLQCETSCIPGSNSLRASLIIGTESKAAADTSIFTEAQRKLSSKQLPGSATARWDAAESVPVRPLLIDWSVEAKSADFFPYTNALVAISNKTDVSSGASNVVLRKLTKSKGGSWPKEVAGLLVREENGSLAGYEVSLPLPTSSGNASSASNAVFQGEKKSLAVWLLYAFIGGLILNIMPCVLPVIALKILGFVKQSQDHPKQVRKLGMLYTLGVLASFLVLAGIVIGVKAAGQRAGWGMQFSNPQFIVILAMIVTLVALNLFGVFEITLAGGAMGAASQAAGKHGSLGAFMNGVLATVLATPCTAPFLGAAAGFALAPNQPSLIVVLMFLVMGFGLALPYLLLSWNPAWLKFMPKPGAWMERFKVVMGFPMLATAVWLFTLTQTFYGKRLWWLGVFLVVLALAAWIYGEFVQRGRKRRMAAVIVVLLLLTGGFVYAVEKKLDWRKPIVEADSNSSWSLEAVAKARAEGHPVVVDFTADWCVTCNTIVKPTLESVSVQAKLKGVNGVMLIADNTKFPPSIATELEKYGRAGVPLVLVFPKDISKPAIVISESLLPGTIASDVIKALEDASK